MMPLNRKKPAQVILAQSLEGIGDILAYETSRKRNSLVLAGLRDLTELMQKFFSIKEKDEEKFVKLALSPEILQVHSQDEKKAKLLLALNSEKHSVPFTMALNQISKIHEGALAIKNSEVSRHVTYALRAVLDDLASRPGNDLFIEQSMNILFDINKRALEEKDGSMYSTSINWYADTVFSSKFDLSYLDMLNRYFDANVREMVQSNRYDLFKTLLGALVSQISVPTFYSGRVRDITHLLSEQDFTKYQTLEETSGIEATVTSLEQRYRDMYESEDLAKWFEEFEGLVNIVKPELSPENLVKAQEFAVEMEENVKTNFKYNRLMEILYQIGAYCLFLDKPDWIKEIWEYKQPPDTDVHWGGHDIVPNDLNEVLKFYFRRNLLSRDFDHWDGHRSSVIYYRRYFVLLLARSLRGWQASPMDGSYTQIAGYTLPSLDIHQLSGVEFFSNMLIEIANDLKGNKELLKALGFDVATAKDLFDKRVIAFLKALKEKAAEALDKTHRDHPLDAERVEAFYKEVEKGYERTSRMREIFKKLGGYADETAGRYQGVVKPRGVNQVDDKAAFFNEWHVTYGEWGVSYGEGLGAGEDTEIMEEISKVSSKDFADIDSALGALEDIENVVVLSSLRARIDLFDTGKFTAVWGMEAAEGHPPSFIGTYDFNGHPVPIYEASDHSEKGRIIVINTSTLGQLVQHSITDIPDSVVIDGHIAASVKAFSENEELLTEFLASDTAWLKQVGDANAQKEYLLRRVLVRIVERIEYVPATTPQAFLIKM